MPSATTPLTDAQLATFREQGWIVLKGALDAGTVDQLQTWADQLHEWAHIDGPGLHHFEETAHGVRVARSEDIIPHHPGLKTFICDDDVVHWVGELFGEPAVLFKEKINYKQAGGGGFAPHQDATAYRFVDHHISVAVPIDAATVDNGCLWFAKGHDRGVLPHHKGWIDDAVCEELDWVPAPVEPGDVVLFDSYAPHKSGTNHSDANRRALYLTYNALAAGDFRDAYYADKKKEFAAAGHRFEGDRARISINDDFLGKAAVKPPKPPAKPLSDLFDRYGSPQAQELYDESITELEHALQCAALARRDGADEATIAAALLHDVGHLLIGDYFPIEMALDKDWKHEDVGARYLSRWYGPEITEPIRMHVAAKRYLVATDPSYGPALSPSSTRSLQVQGGPMSAEEQAAFEAQPGFASAVAVRRWDDEGKDPDMEVPPFSAWTDMLTRLAVDGTAAPAQ